MPSVRAGRAQRLEQRLARSHDREQPGTAKPADPDRDRLRPDLGRGTAVVSEIPGFRACDRPGRGRGELDPRDRLADIRAIATFYRDALQARGLVASIDGPLEDAAMIVSGMDGDGCEVEVGVRPTGATTLIVVLYGAGCSFE